jgi:cellulose synthase (UDP-forming)
MLLLFTMPIVALARGQAWVDIVFLQFIAYFSATYLSSLAILVWTLNKGLGRPWKFGLFRWETMLFPLLKWPWILLGFLAAVFDRLSGSDFDFIVTPKSSSPSEKSGSHVRVAMPYLALSLTAIMPVLAVAEPGNSSGYYVFSSLNAFMYAICFIAILGEGRWFKIDKQINGGQLAAAS